MHSRYVAAACVCAHLCPTLYDSRTVAHQASLSMEFSRKEYWSGVPFPPPGDLPNPGTEPASCLAGISSYKYLTQYTTFLNNQLPQIKPADI